MRHEPDSTAPKERKPGKRPSATHWNFIKNVLAGVIGVQSDEAHKRDLSQDSLETFALKVVVGLALLLLILVLIAF